MVPALHPAVFRSQKKTARLMAGLNPSFMKREQPIHNMDFPYYLHRIQVR